MIRIMIQIMIQIDNTIMRLFDVGPHTSDGVGVGAFVGQLTGLTTHTTYYVRAYATNGVGTENRKCL